MPDPVSTLKLRIFDGSRQLFSPPASFLVTITDGNQTQRIRNYYQANDIDFDLPFFGNLGDNYTVLVYADGYQQAGFVPVTLSDQALTTLDIMLIPADPGFDFANAGYPAVSQLYPFLASETDGVSGADRYQTIQDNNLVRACLLNLCEAISQISIAGVSPLSYFKQLRWNNPQMVPAQDRFFAYCDRTLVNQVRNAPPAQFAVELDPGLLHPGATSSWKQIEFGEANVQLTFHENPADSLIIDGVDCCTIEPDIDYYRDPAAHIILEVIPNAVTQTLTDPAQVYVLRWIAARQAGVAEFAPLFTVT